MKLKDMKTDSNSYTIAYATVLVVVIAFLLAFVFQILKPIQDVNVSLDKQKQILYSLNIRGLDNDAAAESYRQIVLADNVIDANNQIIKHGSRGGTSAGFLLNSADTKAGRLPLYICKVSGKIKYVIPVYGMGLWGPISGYLALDDDRRTVYGAYFNHESETAGLGAEIKDNLKWQQQFRGKKLFSQGDSTKIALSVLKKVKDPSTQVDAVTGATLTSDGVTDMFKECLEKYIVFLNSK